MADMQNPPASPERVLGMERNEFWVESVLGKKFVDGSPLYLVKWLGWPSETNSWEAAETLSNSAAMLEEFDRNLELKENSQGEEVEEMTVSEGEDGSERLEPQVQSDVYVPPGEGEMDFDVLPKCPESKILSRIMGVLEIEGQRVFLTEWQPRPDTGDGPQEEITDEFERDFPERCLVTARSLNLAYPQMVIQFYSQHIKLIPSKNAETQEGIEDSDLIASSIEALALAEGN